MDGIATSCATEPAGGGTWWFWPAEALALVALAVFVFALQVREHRCFYCCDLDCARNDNLMQ